MKLSLNKRIKQRIISFTTAFAMMTNALPMSGLSGIISPLFTISASAADYVPQAASIFNKSNDSDTVSLSTTDALVSYCWHYNRNTPITITNPGESQTNIGFAEYHQNDTLIIAFTGGGEISSDFEGLGSDSYPFGGTIKFGGADYNLNAHRALFNYVYDSVKFQNNADSSTENIIFTRLSSIGTNESKPLLADHQGVLISGTENGNFTVNDSGSIELDGIKPIKGASAYKDGYLLINNIARETDLVSPPSVTIKNLSNTDKYSSTAGGSYNANGTTDTVAKSLLGAASGKGLNIVFSHIKLDARCLTDNAVKTDVALETLYNAYGTYNSIFTDSTLLASINTDQSALLQYYYTYDEDWGTDDLRYVTYGKEVKDSTEYPGEEKKYYGDVDNYTNPKSNTNEEYDFSTGFLPYVREPFTSVNMTENYYRELKVNVKAEGLKAGCGTYNDPYIITDNKTLENVASFIQNGDTSVLSSVVLPKVSGNYDSLTENTSGDRWCTDKTDHATFTPNAAVYTSDENGAVSWSVENVRFYLANAYYKIGNNLELSTNYLGLGSNPLNNTGGNYAFRGVIVGEPTSQTDPTPKWTITNNSNNPFINVSNGCVIKDINIEVGTDISLDQGTNGYDNAYFGYDSKCKYYGGIIGEIMGGDNIIDNSYVTFASGKKVTLTGTNGTIVPVGGYVGVVVFGGLIFKNMDARKTTVSRTGLNVVYTGKTENLADNDKPEDWAAIYVNPIVGRVINGYAVNETDGDALNADGEKFHQFSVTENGKYHNEGRTARSAATVQHTLKNGTKHYSIADIDPELGKLDVASVPVDTSNDGTINVPNSQAMFILSLISETDLAKAKNLRLTISLSKKTDNVENDTVTSVEYVQASDLTKYLDNAISIKSGNYSSDAALTQGVSSLVVDIPIDQCDVEDNIYSIGIAFSAKTGGNFHDYANYMVTLRTELVYTDNNDQVKAVENSGISDYVVYTNAKVFPTLIPKAS